MAGSYAWDLLTHASDWKGAQECFLARYNVQRSPVGVMNDLHKCWILTAESTVAGLESCGSAEAGFMLRGEEECTGGMYPHTHDQLIHFVIAAGADLQSVYFSLHRL